jgi:hypothetical protein
LKDNGQCWVHVEWDNDSCPERGTTNVYRYKMDDDMEGDVRKAANEDRVPPEGNILAVGCRVKEGNIFFQHFKLNLAINVFEFLSDILFFSKLTN